MNVITSSRGKKRQMVLVPEISPSFLFFFEKGTTGYSYSLRDYSVANHVTERRARDFGWTADELRRKATRIFDAPYMDVNLLAEWHSYTSALNESQGIRPTQSSTLVPSAPGIQWRNHATSPTTFPMLNPDACCAAEVEKERRHTTDVGVAAERGLGHVEPAEFGAET